MAEIWLLSALFASAFSSATLLPGTSEAALVAVVLSGQTQWILALSVAILGNVLGAVVNWGMGYYWPQKPRYAQSPYMQRAARWFERYGIWCLLFSWVPVIGDPLTLVAGLAKVRLLTFFGLVLVGKSLRYALVLMTLSSLG